MTADSSNDIGAKQPSPVARGPVIAVIGLGSLAFVAAAIYIVSDSKPEPEEAVTWDAINLAVGIDDYEGTITLCEQLAERDPSQAAEALAIASETAAVTLAQLDRGDQFAQCALAIDPSNQRALASYSRVLTMTGQRWKSISWLAEYVVRYEDSQDELIWLSDTAVVVSDKGLLDAARQAHPDDPLPAFGLAFDSMIAHPHEAVRQLRACLEMRPDMIEAHALLGRALLDAGDEDAFREWDRQLPTDYEIHPDVWRARGKWWRNRDPKNALRCYLECCHRSPEDAQANLQISLLLDQEGEPEAAAVFRARFENIRSYLALLRDVRERRDYSGVLQAAHLAEQLQRPAESLGWYRAAVEHGLATSTVVENHKYSAVDFDSVVASEFDPDRIVDRTRWPLPEPASTGRTPDSVAKRNSEDLRFRDVAQSVGLEFEYVNRLDASDTLRDFETVNGGGVAAIDYDCDGWPDLFFTQAGRSLIRIDENTTHSDPLFRNIDGLRAEDVSSSAGIVDWGYGQGCTVGDFDDDGFPDIVIANTGRNRLFHNCGDGTFEDVTDESGITGDAWTSSLAIADFNSDSWPDLYEVRYVETEDLFEKVCYASEGVRRPCPPGEFTPMDDVIWLSTGDGKFVPLENAGIPTGSGRGLGLIVADFDQRPGLDVFVGNDGSADFLLINQPEADKDMPQFLNEATLRGVAVNGRGRAQGTMGIAYRDFDGDGTLDLFQSNFYGESNSLYLGLGNGYFNDATTHAGLYTASLTMLAWGAEFLDADLDGWPDLVVVNGHLEDKTQAGEPYRMSAQLFRNDGRGRFDEVPATASGAWFQKPRLARALATLDWNRDGQMDFAVTSLDSPAALLTGETSSVGNSITIHLRAVDSARDAIGTKVMIEAGGQQQVHQLIAGDGFQTSNQRTIHTGVGAHEQIDRMTIHWPSGRVQECESLAVKQEILVVEGRDWMTIPRR
jgi:tetratricopeptide (TPR) repeat protein